MTGASGGHSGASEALEEGEIWSAVTGLEAEDILTEVVVPGRSTAQQVTSLPGQGLAKRRH